MDDINIVYSWKEHIFCRSFSFLALHPGSFIESIEVNMFDKIDDKCYH